MSKVLIIGATSAIAQEVAKIMSARGDRLFLVGRDTQKLSAIVDDLAVRGAAAVGSLAVDLNDFSRHHEIIETAWSALDGCDTVLVAHGVLPDQKACEQSYEKTKEVIDTNFTSVVSLLTEIANRFEQTKSGCIAVISSVAGDRARQSNYIYGTTKAAKSAYLQGLRNRLYPSNVAVVTIKPGFVDTPMTAGMKKGGPLWASAGTIAYGIVKAIDKRKNIVYLPWFWFWIMNIVRHIPEFMFKKMKM